MGRPRPQSCTGERNRGLKRTARSRGHQTEIDKLQEYIRVLEEAKAKVKVHEQAKARIEELKAEERRLSREYESLERQQYLCEEFTRTKVKMLDEKINSRFRLARFKLFEEQINGGIADTCVTLCDGVPWDGGLNNGSQINVGIDIINTLAEHYGFSAPIFRQRRERDPDNPNPGPAYPAGGLRAG